MERSYLSKFFSLCFGGVGPRVKVHLYLILFFKKKNFFQMAKFFSDRMQRKYGLFISAKSSFSMSLDLKHPVGVVVGDGVKIGERVKIFQHVTLGGARLGDWQDNNYPEIGDDTVIFAGAIVVGKVKVGKNCVIGANAVVTKDVPAGARVAGNPARVLPAKGKTPVS